MINAIALTTIIFDWTNSRNAHLMNTHTYTNTYIFIVNEIEKEKERLLARSPGAENATNVLVHSYSNEHLR